MHGSEDGMPFTEKSVVMCVAPRFLSHPSYTLPFPSSLIPSKRVALAEIFVQDMQQRAKDAPGPFLTVRT